MRIRWACLIAAAFVVLGFVPGAALGQELYKSTPGPFTVKALDEDWHDPARKRDVPVRIYQPNPQDEDVAPAPRKFPVIVFSHGLGGSRNGYAYFGEHLAGHGYVVIMPTHAGSDTSAIRGLGRPSRAPRDRKADTPVADEEAPGIAAPQKNRPAPGPAGRFFDGLDDPENLRNRPLDISFVIDQLSVNPRLSTIVDLSRVGVAGHSFGAYTAMAIAGMTVDLPDVPDRSFRDRRVKAALPMSPQGPGTMGIDRRAWDKVEIPVLFLTGTKDYGQGQRPAAWRRAPFEHVRGVDDYLATLTDATHMTFGNPTGILTRADASTKSRHAELIRSLSTAFFDTYLNDDAEARAWLRRYFADEHQDCTAEFKPGKT